MRYGVARPTPNYGWPGNERQIQKPLIPVHNLIKHRRFFQPVAVGALYPQSKSLPVTRAARMKSLLPGPVMARAFSQAATCQPMAQPTHTATTAESPVDEVNVRMIATVREGQLR